ncbi:MAG: UvrD/REP helicase [Spirochaetes bacterium]|nr:MAG: UvrD/REP helicase [Spirochaetota bacterium]
MTFLIADTFTDSLARLSGDEQKAVKTTAFDLQLNPAYPGMSFHKIDNSKDKNFWSVRVNSDIRIIVHKSESSLLLCYVDHHDKAYSWAERRKLEKHPKTGAAQLVEIREIAKDVPVPLHSKHEAEQEYRLPTVRPPLFAQIPEETLLSYGIPIEWLADVKQATEETLLALTDHLPAEASEALLELATGGKPRAQEPIIVPANPFEHPDAQRRFRVMSNMEELQRALEYPWEKWTVFLHPEQRQIVERDYAGPARVSGSAGTGKTIVALHRAVYLARKYPESRVLLTTFSDPLANSLKTKLRRLIGTTPSLAERIDVYSLDAIGSRLFHSNCGKFSIVNKETLKTLLKEASEALVGQKFSLHFLLDEWEQIVDAWQVRDWDSYRQVARLGRKTRISEAQRTIAWSVFERVREGLRTRGQITWAVLFTRLAETIPLLKNAPFDYIVVDEAQDIGIAHIKFLAALGKGRPNTLFFAGDQGQRIFQQPFSWKSLGVDIRGRSKTLRVNYRTSHQIRSQADRLLDPVLTDIDGNREDRHDTVSVFNGPPPTIITLKSESEETEAVGEWLSQRQAEGLRPHEMGIFVRSTAQVDRARSAADKSELPYKILDEHVATMGGYTSIGTMNLAKGLEFRAVVVMACDDEVIPLQERIEQVSDESDLHEVYDTERHLLYVACTRARDFLLISSVEPKSEFLDDLLISS